MMIYRYSALSTGISAFVMVLASFILAVPKYYAYAQALDTQIVVNPKEITLAPLSNQQFSAYAKVGKKMLDPGPAITWKAQGGTINSVGTYMAPAAAGQYQITASSGSIIATATITVDESVVPPYKLTSPNKGETFKVGETITITWEANLNEVSDAGLSATLDGGATLENIYGQSISPEHDIWGEYPWVVPEKLGEVPMAGKQIVIRVHEYYGGKFDNCDLPVNIIASAGVANPTNQNEYLLFPAQNVIYVNSLQPYRVSIVSLTGKKLHQYRNSGPKTFFLRQIGLSEGFYMLHLETGDKTISKRLPYFKVE